MAMLTPILALLAAAAAPAAVPAPPPVGGTISIEPRRPDGSFDPAVRPFADAVSAALTARGFTVFPDAGHAASVAVLAVTQEDVGTALTRSRGGRGVSMMGAGLSVPLSSGASDVVPLRRTRMDLHVRRRGGTRDAWSGAVVTVRAASAADGSGDALAADLARALVRAYPAPVEQPIGVP